MPNVSIKTLGLHFDNVSKMASLSEQVAFSSYNDYYEWYFIDAKYGVHLTRKPENTYWTGEIISRREDYDENIEENTSIIERLSKEYEPDVNNFLAHGEINYLDEDAIVELVFLMHSLQHENASMLDDNIRARINNLFKKISDIKDNVQNEEWTKTNISIETPKKRRRRRTKKEMLAERELAKEIESKKDDKDISNKFVLSNENTNELDTSDEKEEDCENLSVITDGGVEDDEH